MKRFKVLIIVLAIVGLLVFAAGAVYTFRHTLITPHLVALVTRHLEKEWGLRTTIQEVSGDYLRTLAIDKLQILSDDSPTPIEHIAVRQVRLAYSLWDLVQGLQAFITNSHLEISGAHVALLMRPSAPAGADASGAGFELPSLPSLPALPSVRINDSEVFLKAPNFSHAFNGMSMQLQPGSTGAMGFDLDLAQWQWRHEGITQGSEPLKLTIRYTPQRLSIERLQIGTKALEAKLLLGLAELPQNLPFNLEASLFEAPLSLGGNLDSRSLSARLDTKDLDLEPLSGYLVHPLLQMAGKMDALGEVDLDWTEADWIKGSLQLGLANGRWGDLAIDHVALEALTTGKELQIKHLQAMAHAGRIRLTDVRLPFALLTGSAEALLSPAVRAEYHLDLNDIPRVLAMSGIEGRPFNGEAPSHRLVLSGSLADKKLVIDQGDLTVGDNRLRFKPSSATLPETLAGWQTIQIDTRVFADLPLVAQAAELFRLPPLAGRLQAEVDLKGALLTPQGSITLNAQDIAVGQAPIGDIEIDARGDAGAVAIERLLITQGPDRIEGRGRVDWQRQQLAGIELKANFFDPGRYLAALPLEEQNLERLQNLRGSFQAHLRLAGDFNQPQGRLELEGQRLAWEGLEIDELKTRIRHEAGRITVEACEIDNAQDAIRLSGAWLIENNMLEDTRLDFNLADIQPYFGLLGQNGVQLQGDLKGSLTASGPLQAPLVVFENTSQQLRINDHELKQLDTRIRYSDRRLQIEALTASMLDGVIRLAGVLEHDEAFQRLDAQLADLAYDSPQGDLKLQKPSTVGLTTVPTFHVDELHLDGSLGTIRIGGELSLDSQLDFSVAASLRDGQGWSEDPISSGSLEAHMQVGGTWQAPTLSMDIMAQELRLTPALIPPALGPFNLQSRLRYEVGNFMLETLELESPVLTITGKGRWENGPTPDLLAEDPAAWRRGTLAVEGQLESPDISWLAAHAPAIRRIGGRINAQIRIDGPLSQPALDCIVALDEGELRTTADLPTLQQLSLRASATPEAVTIEYLRGLLGGSPFNLDGQVKQVFSTNPQVDLHLWGQNLLFFRNQDLRLRADTDLKLTGSYEDMLLAGDVAISYGRFSKYLDLLGNLQGNRPPSVNRGLQLFSLRDPPLRDLRLNVKVDSRNPFIIRNNLLRGELRTDLTLKGTGELPVLNGRVFVDTGRLRLPSGSIVIENGLVQFLPSDPDRPMLDMIGRTRMLGYDITMLIEGPYDEPAITLSSVPPLANEELLMLVLTGRPPSVDGQAVAQDNTQYNVAVFVGRDLIDRWFQGSDGGSMDGILDRFESEIGRDVSQGGEETLEAQFRMADGVLHSSDSLYLTGERDVFDFYNVGLKIVFRFR